MKYVLTVYVLISSIAYGYVIGTNGNWNLAIYIIWFLSLILFQNNLRIVKKPLKSNKK